MTVNTMGDAWKAAAGMVAGEVIHNESRSSGAGYPVYDAGDAYICSLGDRLEVNFQDGKTVNIWIEAEAEAEAAEVEKVDLPGYVDFCRSERKSVFECDGHFTGCKTIKGAAAALNRAIKYLAGRDLLAMICDDFSAANMRFLAKENNSWNDEFEIFDFKVYPGESYRYYWQEKKSGCFLRCHIEKIDDEYFYIDFGCDLKNNKSGSPAAR